MSATRPAFASIALRLALVAGGVVLSACGDAAPTAQSTALAHSSHAAASSGVLSAGTADQIAQLRALTAPFHRIDAAAAAGWDTRITGCFDNPPAGGMGFHYGNLALIDGRVDALEPELLLYEPQKNGRMRLVAVEYIVPFDLWTASEPPQLYGQSFHRNDGFGLWVLHVWHFAHNPNGMFADWNPTVSCRHATS